MDPVPDIARLCPLNPDGSLQEPIPPVLLRVLEETSQAGAELLDVLRAVHGRFGFLCERYLRHIAAYRGITRFTLQRTLQADASLQIGLPGIHRIRVCRAESCSDEGAGAIIGVLARQLGIAPEETTPNGHFSLETAYCFGLCSHAPVIDIDSVKYVRMDPDRAWQQVQDVSMAVDP